MYVTNRKGNGLRPEQEILLIHEVMMMMMMMMIVRGQVTEYNCIIQ
jgi:hypothetical protein